MNQTALELAQTLLPLYQEGHPGEARARNCIDSVVAYKLATQRLEAARNLSWDLLLAMIKVLGQIKEPSPQEYERQMTRIALFALIWLAANDPDIPAFKPLEAVEIEANGW
jgi:hypothetical protein